MNMQLFSTLEEELRKLEELRDESNFRKFLDHEDEQNRIKDVFVRINDARVWFVRVCRISFLNENVILLSQQGLYFDRLDRLEPSDIAHHDYILEGEEA